MMSIGAAELAILCSIVFLLIMPIVVVAVVLLVVSRNGRTKPK